MRTIKYTSAEYARYRDQWHRLLVLAFFGLHGNEYRAFSPQVLGKYKAGVTDARLVHAHLAEADNLVVDKVQQYVRIVRF